MVSNLVLRHLLYSHHRHSSSSNESPSIPYITSTNSQADPPILTAWLSLTLSVFAYKKLSGCRAQADYDAGEREAGVVMDERNEIQMRWDDPGKLPWSERTHYLPIEVGVPRWRARSELASWYGKRATVNRGNRTLDWIDNAEQSSGD